MFAAGFGAKARAGFRLQIIGDLGYFFTGRSIIQWVNISKDIMRRRGNPNWGRTTTLFMPKVPTEFELLVKRLRLTQEKYMSSPELKRWCKSNRNRCYIPEWLLKEWNLEVDLYYGPGTA